MTLSTRIETLKAENRKDDLWLWKNLGTNNAGTRHLKRKTYQLIMERTDRIRALQEI